MLPDWYQPELYMGVEDIWVHEKAVWDLAINYDWSEIVLGYTPWGQSDDEFKPVRSFELTFSGG